MQLRRIFVLGGVTAAVVFVPASAALAAKVSVRVESKSKTLLSRTVQTPNGSITKGGAPRGLCPGSSAAGALNVAARGNWNGTFESSFNDYELTTILGEKWTFSSPNYWGVWVNNKYASTGICEIKLKPKDQLLFAVDPAKHPEHPLGLTGPKKAKVGKPFNVKVVWYSDKGKAKPLRGVQITGATPKNSVILTSKQGIAKITPRKAGKLKLLATTKGYIRSALTSVSVSS
jgi:hypothetical protein